MTRGSKTGPLGALLAKLPEPGKLLEKVPRDAGAFALTALLLLVVFPVGLSGFRLAMVSKYLTYAFPAIALV